MYFWFQEFRRKFPGVAAVEANFLKTRTYVIKLCRDYAALRGNQEVAH